MPPNLIDYLIKFSISDFLHPYDVDTYPMTIQGDVVFTDQEEHEHSVGYIEAHYMPTNYDAEDTGYQSFEVFDALSTEMTYCYETLFDKNGDDFKQSINDQFNGDIISTDILYIDAIFLEPKHRSKGLGLAVILRLIQRFGPHMGIVAMLPSPITSNEHNEGNSNNGSASPEQSIELAREKLRRYYARIGFQQIGDTDIVALCTSYSLPTLKDLCPELLT